MRKRARTSPRASRCSLSNEEQAFQEGPRRQSRRDRHPRHARVPRARHRHSRDLLRRGPQRDPRALRGRGTSHRRRAADVMCLVRVARVDRVAVRVGVDRDCGDAELAARAHDADGDLAAIGDEDLLEKLALHSTASNGWLGVTFSPSFSLPSLPRPATVVTMSFCIFIASSTATTSPSLTSSPVLTGIFTINPCMGAITVPSTALGGGAAPALVAAPAAAETVIPAPVTRTLKTSPSTSTSNSAVETGAAGGGSGTSGAGICGSGAGAAGRGFDRFESFAGGPLRYCWARLGNMRWIRTLSSLGS